jgi:hypothetical protein
MRFNPVLALAAAFGFGYTGGGGYDPLDTRVERAAAARQNRAARAEGRYYAETVAPLYVAPVYVTPRVEFVIVAPICFKLRRGVLHRRR